MSFIPFIIGHRLGATWLGQALLFLSGGLWIAAVIASGSIAEPRVSTLLAFVIAAYGLVKLLRRLRRR